MLRKRAVLFLLMLLAFNFSSPSWAVIILDSTFKQFGFKKAEALANAPQFKSLMYLLGEDESGSGSWIGNYQGHGYVLTAAHLFTAETQADYYDYITRDGTKYEGEELYINPLWNRNFSERTGYDFAIIKLNKEVTNAGPKPALYAGTAEEGKLLTFMGYGYRGAGTKGEDTSIDTEDRPAAAVGLIESIDEAVKPVPKKGDAGNYMGIWLPKEDGSEENPINDDGITKPISPLSGILGSGDSGGPAWIMTRNGWAIAGVNSDGSGNAEYGDTSWFPRVSGVRDWIVKIVPTVSFIQ